MSPVELVCVVALPVSPRGLIEISTDELALLEVVIVPLTEHLDVSTHHSSLQSLQLTFPVHIGIEIHFCDVVGRRRLNPDTLPDPAAWCVEDVRRM